MNRDSRELDVALRALAAAVRSHREKLGISQEELAHRSGLHRTYISDIERGSRNVAFKNLVRLADALEISIADLFLDSVFHRKHVPGDADTGDS